MGLREQAKLDARAILEDASGFAWPVTLTSPLGVVISVNGFTTDVGQTIDPETGQAVAGRRASCALARGALPELPEAVAEGSRRPWVATFVDSQGELGSWKVIEVLPDRAAGVVVLLLEAYRLGPVRITGTLTMPALQLAGALSPAVDLTGELTMPALQLADASVSPLLALAGALSMPPLQVAGALAPAVDLTGTPTMPALQVAGDLAVAVGALGAFYRKAASTPVADEWQTIVDILGGASLVQNGGVRRIASSTSANALPIGIYDGTDCMRMPLHAGNFNTSKYGISKWLRPVATGAQYIFVIYNNDAGARVLTWGVTTGGRLFLEIYIGSNVDGRTYETATGVVLANVYQYPRVQIDMTRTAEFDTTGANADSKIRMFMGEVGLALTAASFGLGGSPTVLRTPNLSGGAAIFGAVNDTDTPSGALENLTREGPNSYIWTATPTAQQAAAVMNFEVPT